MFQAAGADGFRHIRILVLFSVWIYYAKIHLYVKKRVLYLTWLNLYRAIYKPFNFLEYYAMVFISKVIASYIL